MKDTSNNINNTNPIVLFDGVCNFCNTSVRFLLAYNRKENLHFASLQSDFAQKVLSQYGVTPHMDTVIFIEDGNIYTKSKAFFEICKHLIYPWKAMYYFKYIPSSITNWIYDLIAKHRYKLFGKRKKCMVPRPEWRDRFYE